MMNARKHAKEMTVEGFLNALLLEKNVKKALFFLGGDIYWTQAMIAHEACGLGEVGAGLDRLWKRSLFLPVNGLTGSHV